MTKNQKKKQKEEEEKKPQLTQILEFTDNYLKIQLICPRQQRKGWVKIKNFNR